MKVWNSTLTRRTPLKAKSPLKARKGLNKISKKQVAKNKHWQTIVGIRIVEEDYKCQFCGMGGSRAGFNPLVGHHLLTRALGGLNSQNNCMIVHQKCHAEIHDKIGTKKIMEAMNVQTTLR